MSYSKINWENSPSTSTPINASNLNKMDNQIAINETNITTNTSDISGLDTRLTTAEGDIDALEATTQNTNFTLHKYSAGGAIKSVTGTTYVNLGPSTTFTAKKGGPIIVFLKIGGLYNSNNGYSIQVDIKVDNTTTSTSGTFSISPGWLGTNIDTTGSSLAYVTNMFYFTDLENGLHTFQLQWRSSNSSITSYMAAYGGYDLTIFEL